MSRCPTATHATFSQEASVYHTHCPEQVTRLLVKALHGQQARLGLRAARSGALGRGQRLAVARIESRMRAQEARHQKVEQRPELQDVVLYWGAAEDEPVLCVDALDGLQRTLETRAVCISRR